ncbi:MAG: glucokinase, partial [Betaproteobacteria bacterium]|nr:glucokinase [Betaproteobacteria bacterium]
AWRLSAASIAGAFGFGKVRLINDFEAAGLGIASLTAEDLATLQTGTPVPRGMRLVLGAGTGLGVAVLAWHGDGYVVHPSEGGHTDFAPLDETQDALLQYLRRSFGRVSYERAVSGPGLMRLFSLLEESGAGVPSKPLLEAIQRQDPAEAIAEFAASRLDPLAVHALDLFVAIYGAFAGNMALTVLARGGVYIAGGIAPKIVTRLQEGGFMRAFTDKGRFSALLATVPVHVVMNPKVGLFGALAAAQRLV